MDSDETEFKYRWLRLVPLDFASCHLRLATLKQPQGRLVLVRVTIVVTQDFRKTQKTSTLFFFSATDYFKIVQLSINRPAFSD
jgi:hypothetical protein